MPFPIVWGIPDDTPTDLLVILRRDIVRVIASKMNVPTNWVHVFFPKDLLPEPRLDGTEGGNTIYVSLDTGMFRGKENTDQHVKKVTHAVAHVVWGAFGCLREVECMVGDCNPNWTSLIEAMFAGEKKDDTT